MSTKTNSLQAVLEAANKNKEPAQDSAPEAEAKPQAKKALKKPTKTKSSESSAKRGEGTTLIAGHFPKSVSKQLKLLAVEEDTTNQELLSQALDLLFVKKGKKRIGDLT